MNQPAEIDLQPELHLFLVEWAQQYPEIEQIDLFGSRALGNAKKGSDVDLAVVGTQVTQSLVDKLHATLEEDTLFPYLFELVFVLMRLAITFLHRILMCIITIIIYFW